MKKIRRIKALSLGKLLGAIYGFMAFIAGAFITAISLLIKNYHSSRNISDIFIGVGAIILLPIVYGIFGFIFGILIGWLYNIAAKWTRGLEVEIDGE